MVLYFFVCKKSTRKRQLLGLLNAPLWMDGGDKDISDLKCLGSTHWIDLNRNDNEYWELGITKVCKATGLTENSLMN